MLPPWIWEPSPKRPHRQPNPALSATRLTPGEPSRSPSIAPDSASASSRPCRCPFRRYPFRPAAADALAFQAQPDAEGIAEPAGDGEGLVTEPAGGGRVATLRGDQGADQCRPRVRPGPRCTTV